MDDLKGMLAICININNFFFSDSWHALVKTWNSAHWSGLACGVFPSPVVHIG